MLKIIEIKEGMIWKYFFNDLMGVLLLILISSLGGLLINEMRSNSIPLFIQESESNAVGVINTVSLKEMQHLKNMQQAILLDARLERFYREGHIPGAFNLSRQNFEADLTRLLEKIPVLNDKQLVVYCSNISCEDSKWVGERLSELGLTKISLFKGGWQEWQASDLPKETNP